MYVESNDGIECSSYGWCMHFLPRIASTARMNYFSCARFTTSCGNYYFENKKQNSKNHIEVLTFFVNALGVVIVGVGDDDDGG